MKWRTAILFAWLALDIGIWSQSESMVAAGQQRVLGGTGTSSVSPAGTIGTKDSLEGDLEEYRRAMAEYLQLLKGSRKAFDEYKELMGTALDRSDERGSEGIKEVEKKVVEIVTNGGLTVAAILFGFFAFLLGSLQVTKDNVVRGIYWLSAWGTGIGVLVALATSIFGVLALRYEGPAFVVTSLILSAVTGACVSGVTVYFLWHLAGKKY